MPVEDFIGHELVAALDASSRLSRRGKAAIAAWNAASPVLKRGIALTPVKFGISFTLTWLNQAGALVHVYQDGSVQLNHGGTEMGQGLFQKVAQVAAGVFGVEAEAVKITATDTAQGAEHLGHRGLFGGGPERHGGAGGLRDDPRRGWRSSWPDGIRRSRRDVRFAGGRVRVGGRRLRLRRGGGDGLSGAGVAVVDRLLRARPRSSGTGCKGDGAARSSTSPMARR